MHLHGRISRTYPLRDLSGKYYPVWSMMVLFGVSDGDYLIIQKTIQLLAVSLALILIRLPRQLPANLGEI